MQSKRAGYRVARIMIGDYKKIKSGRSDVERIYAEAIENAIADTEELPNGADRMAAVRMVCINQTHTIAGAAKRLNYDYYSVRGYVRAFTNKVTDNVGF